MSTPSHKGQFITCNDCIFKLDESKRYPCEHSHKKIKELENKISRLRRNINIYTFKCKEKRVKKSQP